MAKFWCWLLGHKYEFLDLVGEQVGRKYLSVCTRCNHSENISIDS